MRLLPSPAGVEVPLIEGVKNCVNRLSGALSALYRYRDIGGISGGFTRIDGGVCVVVKEFGTSEGDIPVAFVAAGRWVFPEVSFKECRDSVDGRSCSGAGDGYCLAGREDEIAVFVQLFAELCRAAFLVRRSSDENSVFASGFRLGGDGEGDSVAVGNEVAYLSGSGY